MNDPNHKMPCHITDEKLVGDPQDADDDTRCASCGDFNLNWMWSDLCAPCAADKVDAEIKARREDALLGIAQGIKDDAARTAAAVDARNRAARDS